MKTTPKRLTQKEFLAQLSTLSGPLTTQARRLLRGAYQKGVRVGLVDGGIIFMDVQANVNLRLLQRFRKARTVKELLNSPPPKGNRSPRL